MTGPDIPSASRLAGKMSELPPRYPSSPLTNETLKGRPEQKGKERKGKENAEIYGCCRRSPHLSESLGRLHPSRHLGGNFPTSVPARESTTACSHTSLGISLQICRCLHMSAFRPIAYPATFPSAFCWSYHRLQWPKMFPRVWATILPAPVHQQHLSSSRWPNCFK
jgi:hypothetical protein